MKLHILYSLVLLLEAYLVVFTIKIGIPEFAQHGTLGVVINLALTVAVLLYGLFFVHRIIYGEGVAFFARHPAINSFFIIIPLSVFGIPVLCLTFFGICEGLYPGSHESLRADPHAQALVAMTFSVLKMSVIIGLAAGSAWFTARTHSSKTWLWLGVAWLCAWAAFRHTNLSFHPLAGGGRYLSGVYITLGDWPPHWASGVAPLLSAGFIYVVTMRKTRMLAGKSGKECKNTP